MMLILSSASESTLGFLLGQKWNTLKKTFNLINLTTLTNGQSGSLLYIGHPEICETYAFLFDYAVYNYVLSVDLNANPANIHA